MSRKRRMPASVEVPITMLDNLERQWLQEIKQAEKDRDPKLAVLQMRLRLLRRARRKANQAKDANADFDWIGFAKTVAFIYKFIENCTSSFYAILRFLCITKVQVKLSNCCARPGAFPNSNLQIT